MAAILGILVIARIIDAGSSVRTKEELYAKSRPL